MSIESSSEIVLRQKAWKNLMQIDNQPFRMECTITGTVAEVADKVITWDSPDPKSRDKNIEITGKGSDGTIRNIRGGIFCLFVALQ